MIYYTYVWRILRELSMITKLFWLDCEKVLTLRPQILKQMFRQHYNIPTTTAIQSLKRSESMPCVLSANTTSLRGYSRLRCFSSLTDIS